MSFPYPQKTEVRNATSCKKEELGRSFAGYGREAVAEEVLKRFPRR